MWLDGWWAPMALGGIPVVWHAINRCRESCKHMRANRKVPLVELGMAPDTQAWCQGCDELKPVRDMAFVDVNGDGYPDWAYRCRECRKPYEPEPEPEVDWTIGPGRVVELQHPQDCQCTNCVGYQRPVPAWGGEAIHAFEPMTPEQVENARGQESAAIEVYRRAGVNVTQVTNEAYERGIQARRKKRTTMDYNNPYGIWMEHGTL